jgi:hypothetical protein
MGHRGNFDKFIDETRASQRNIVFPDTVRNARSVDLFLWKGSPNPRLVQRIGAWMIGLWLIGIGMLFMSLAAHTYVEAIDAVKRSEALPPMIVLVIMSAPFVFGGARVFRNGFPRTAKPQRDSNHGKAD